MLYNILKNIVDRNLLNYLAIGVINTSVGFGLIFLLMYINIVPEVANFMGYLTGFLVSFHLNKKYNFRSQGALLKEIKKFAIAMAIAYLINLFVLIIELRIFNVNKYYAQIIASAFYVVTGYLLSKFWVFKG